MLRAEIHGKIPSLEFSEDLLTSSVFGTLEYLGSPRLLSRFLAAARNLAGQRLPKSLLDLQDVAFQFWPRMADGTEPDLLLKATDTQGQRALLLIEAKYAAPKGRTMTEAEGDAPAVTHDQLSIEFGNLMGIESDAAPERRALIYLTAHSAFPRIDVEESIQGTVDALRDQARERMFWLSWRELHGPLMRHLADCDRPGAYELAQDLLLLLDRKELRRFDGHRLLSLPATTPAEVRFYAPGRHASRRPRTYRWPVDHAPASTGFYAGAKRR